MKRRATIEGMIAHGAAFLFLLGAVVGVWQGVGLSSTALSIAVAAGLYFLGRRIMDRALAADGGLRQAATPAPLTAPPCGPVANAPAHGPATSAAPRDPQLPGKGDPARHYVDDAEIVIAINEAIDHAQAGDWTAVEDALSRAKGKIAGFEPYDTSDAYWPLIWEGDIETVRAFVEWRRGET